MIIITDIESPWLDALESRMGDTKEPLENAGEGLLAAMRQQITGGKLQGLAQSTREQKAELGEPMTPLIATGGLLDSLRPGGRDNVLNVTGDTVEAGTANKVAELHVTGTRRLPRRDFTLIPDATYDEICDQVLSWMIEENQ